MHPIHEETIVLVDIYVLKNLPIKMLELLDKCPTSRLSININREPQHTYGKSRLDRCGQHFADTSHPHLYYLHFRTALGGPGNSADRIFCIGLVLLVYRSS